MYAVKSLCVTEPICWFCQVRQRRISKRDALALQNVKNVRRSMAYAKRVNVLVVTAMLRMKSPQACGKGFENLANLDDSLRIDLFRGM